jgi:hypothetical protein
MARKEGETECMQRDGIEHKWSRGDCQGDELLGG